MYKLSLVSPFWVQMRDQSRALILLFSYYRVIGGKKLKLHIKKLHKNAKLPVQAKKGSAGYDVYACLGDKTMVIAPSTYKLIPTGLAIQIPFGYEIQVRPRSGLALKYGITVLNTPGTIDHGYLDEIGVILINHGDMPFKINDGERIAQLVLKPVLEMEFEEVDDFEGYDRKGGFGSSGV